MALSCYSGAGGLRGRPLKRLYSETSEEEEEEEEEGEAECWSYPYVYIFQPHSRQSKVSRVLNPYLTAFLVLFEDDVVQDFLWVDSCAKVADKYLLAMVYVYFRRASLPVNQYNRTNFFAALYLANDMEEDEDEEKYEIFPWALGEGWLHKFPSFLAHRDQLWRRMNFRAVVSRKTCEEVITMAPHHDIWQRSRRAYHGGAIRAYAKPPSPQYGRTSPVHCEHCARAQDGEEQGERERERKVEGEGWGAWEEDPETEDPLPKFDLLDEIDFSTGMARDGHFQLGDENKSSFGKTHTETVGAQYKE